MVPNLYTQADNNVHKTWLLMAGFCVFVILIAWIFSRALQVPILVPIAVIVTVAMNFISYWHSDKIALAMSGARPIPRGGNERVYRIVENLSITAGLPMPRMFLIPSQQINAFATGRNAQHAAVAVTQGSLDKLDDNELTGVLAHELSHVGNRDILLSTVVVVLAGLVAILSDWFFRITFWSRRDNDRDREANAIFMVLGIVAAILAPIAATLIQLAISRKREFLADASGALLTRYPEGLASALEKISNDDMPMRTAHSATAHLFLANPFKGRDGMSWMSRLFMTHPPLQERIKILRAME